MTLKIIRLIITLLEGRNIGTGRRTHGNSTNSNAFIPVRMRRIQTCAPVRETRSKRQDTVADATSVRACIRPITVLSLP